MSVLKGNKRRNNAKFKEIAEYYNIEDSMFNGDNVKDLETMYTMMGGTLTDELKGNENALAAAIAKIYSTDLAGDSAE
jgi:hypothetical protein